MNVFFHTFKNENKILYLTLIVSFINLLLQYKRRLLHIIDPKDYLYGQIN